MSLNATASFGGGIKSKAVTSPLLGEGSSLRVSSLSFGLPVSASAVSKPVFYIKATEDKTKISTPMLSVSGKNDLSYGYLAAGERALDICMDHNGYNFTTIIYY